MTTEAEMGQWLTKARNRATRKLQKIYRQQYQFLVEIELAKIAAKEKANVNA